MYKAQKIKALELAIEMQQIQYGSSCGHIVIAVDEVMRRSDVAQYIELLSDYSKLFGAVNNGYGYRDIDTDMWRYMAADERQEVRLRKLTDYLNYVENME